MSIEDAEQIVPKETQAVIALLKKGMFGRGFFFVALKMVFYAVVIAVTAASATTILLLALLTAILI